MINVILISLIFGISQKLADAVNEHGTVLFKGANIFFGIIFGISGSILISIDSTFAEFYLGLVLYWLIADKLDFLNHQLSGSIMILVALYNLNSSDINVLNIIFVISIFFLFKIVKNYLSSFNLQINYSFEKKIHHFVIAIILGLWFSNWLITISIILTIVGIMATIQVLKNKNNYHNCSF
jgi:hypothetical protein